mmetsp:Transcript_14375/g.27856  ORF Transcript_14375/g.27856 Transcript_14375/m.27856 type:complete len:543 (+) Transcript_14375:117-1745(+)
MDVENLASSEETQDTEDDDEEDRSMDEPVSSGLQTAPASERAQGNRKPVYGARDFGYTYAKVSQDEDLERNPEPAQANAKSGKSDASLWMFADDEYGKQEYLPFQHVSYSEDEPDVDPQVAAAVGGCACCCLLSFAALIAGAFLQSGIENESGTEIAGTVLLAVGVFLFVVMLLLCCISIGVCCSKGSSLGNTQKSNTRKWAFKRLNDRFTQEIDAYDNLRYYVGDRSKEFKEKGKKESKENSSRKKTVQSQEDEALKKDLESGLTTTAIQNRRRPTIFKIVFDGDIYVSTIDSLRDQITMCLVMGSKYDTVCVVLTSGGGAVTMYGLAAAQLARVRKRGMKLIVCVDSIAASGGYMMAAMADEIYASPFALVGSIGVISIVPNVQKLLEKHNISTYVFTAGKYKRTVDVIGEVTEDGKKKMHEELEEIHQVFKDHIVANRPALRETIDEVATGEAWLAIEGKKKGLVDVLETSDEYLLSMAPSHDLIEIKPRPVKKFPENLFESAAKATASIWGHFTSKAPLSATAAALSSQNTVSNSLAV